MTRTIVRVDDRLFDQVQQRLGEFHRRAPNAIANALNRAASTIKSNASKKLRQEYNVKAGDIKETLAITKASGNNLGAVVLSTGGTIGLEKFKVSPKTVKPRRKSPIKVAVKKGPTKPLPGAFPADISGIKIFRRKTNARLPIERLYGPSVPQMIDQEGIRDPLEQLGIETFHARLEHEIRRIVEQGRARGIS